MFAVYLETAQKFTEPSADNNTIFVAIYTLKALKALKAIGCVIDDVDLDIVMPSGKAGLVMRQ
jgi:hypothetical protein